ncbi:glycosyltransferase family 39 protein [Streptomyces sp. ISL-44]|uniref:glycosyltransferase family 39 protein n=1 Tax=Streptomyces sp. ISL-44 TaxID=2819184 RepID=UPI001BE8D966|nr:glycosyltransferase family 39 protein [Streptomyces sp. ISL-44]MBT2541817.1 glycosyltransferase family 39 protein [Streptomyces sp. ISL-44]
MATGRVSVSASPLEMRAVKAVRSAAPATVIALGVFAAVRGAGVLVLTLGSWWAGKEPLRVLGKSWDSVWYLGIAANGYGRTQMWADPVTGTGFIQSDYAFFPLYPTLIRLVGAVLPGGLIPAGILVAWICAAVAAVGVYRIGEWVIGPRAGLLLVGLWAALPHAVVLSLAYTEALLAALAAWALYALMRGRWLWAAGLAVLAGLTRPTGLAVAAAVSVMALHEILSRRSRAPEVWVAGLLAPAGWAAYVLAVGVRVRDPLGGYFTVQRRWGSRFDFGAGALRSAERVLTGGHVPLATTVTVVLLAAAGLLAMLLVLDRTPLPLLAYTAILLVIAYGGAGFFESKPRFLLPAFPLLLPVAAVMARARPRTAVVVTAALAGLSYGYGLYLLLVARVPL